MFLLPPLSLHLTAPSKRLQNSRQTMQAASLSTKTVFDMEKNAIVRSRLQLVEAMMRERNAAGAAKLAARAKM